MRLVGIDAGGTKTDFLLCDENLLELARITKGGANPNDIGIDACVALLCEGLSELCSDGEPNAVFAGVSGGGYGEHASKISSALGSLYPSALVEAQSDALNLIYSSPLSSNPKATVGALICGTGTGLFIHKNNELFRLYGWGHLFDNGGSAYDFGRDAIRILLKSEENPKSALSTPLMQSLTAKLGSSAHVAIPELYRLGKPYIASFAPTVFEAVEKNDTDALRILELNTDILAERITLAESIYGKIDELVCAGGLFASRAFVDSLSQKTDVKLNLLTYPPVLGACKRAKAMLEKARNNN